MLIIFVLYFHNKPKKDEEKYAKSTHTHIYIYVLCEKSSRTEGKKTIRHLVWTDNDGGYETKRNEYENSHGTKRKIIWQK